MHAGMTPHTHNERAKEKKKNRVTKTKQTVRKKIGSALDRHFVSFRLVWFRFSRMRVRASVCVRLRASAIILSPRKILTPTLRFPARPASPALHFSRSSTLGKTGRARLAIQSQSSSTCVPSRSPREKNSVVPTFPSLLYPLIHLLEQPPDRRMDGRRSRATGILSCASKIACARVG